jgi:hypothetical protein
MIPQDIKRTMPYALWGCLCHWRLPRYAFPPSRTLSPLACSPFDLPEEHHNTQTYWHFRGACWLWNSSKLLPSYTVHHPITKSYSFSMLVSSDEVEIIPILPQHPIDDPLVDGVHGYWGCLPRSFWLSPKIMTSFVTWRRNFFTSISLNLSTDDTDHTYCSTITCYCLNNLHSIP